MGSVTCVRVGVCNVKPSQMIIHLLCKQVNKILKQMWPFISEFMTEVLKNQVQHNIDDIMPDYCKGFRFDKVDFGSIAPRLASVKCYDEQTSRDEIILDLELT